MVIVDASVWIDYLSQKSNPETDWLDWAIGREQIGLTSLSFCEILQGVRHDGQFRRFRADLLRFPVFEDWNLQLATASAQNFRRLRLRGITVRGTIDCLVATFCIELDHRLLHKDRDFDAFERHLGLQVIHPPAAPRPQ